MNANKICATVLGLCLCSALPVTSQVFAADWVHLRRSKLGIIVSYDASSIRQTGEETLQAMVMLQDDTPESFTFGHSAIKYREVLYEINCRSDSYRMIEVRDFFADGYREVIKLRDVKWEGLSSDPIIGELSPIICHSEDKPHTPARE